MERVSERGPIPKPARIPNGFPGHSPPRDPVDRRRRLPQDAAMHNQGEHPERTANEPPEHLTFAEAGERLGVSADAARMRANRGKLATIEVDGYRFVLWPQPAAPEHPNEPRTERTSSANRSAVQDDSRLIAALEDRIGALERQLTERTEEIRRRDHIIAGFIERLPEPLELPATVAPQDGPRGPESAQDAPAPAALAQDTPSSLWARLQNLFRPSG